MSEPVATNQEAIEQLDQQQPEEQQQQQPKQEQQQQTQEPVKLEDSRSNSNRNTPVPQSGLQFQLPSSHQNLKPEEIIGGAPVRQWLNENVTPFLLQGVRKISEERPEDPLKALGEYLIEQSKINKDQN